MSNIGETMSSGNNGRGRGGNRGRVKPRIKRQEVESEDGWTVITHGLSNVKLDDGVGEKDKKKVAGAMPSQTVKDLTAEKLMAEFEKLQGRWVDSAVARQVKELVSKKTRDVDTAACIGVGSFSRDWEHRWRSVWQLVLFVDVVRQLGTKVQMYAQDPAFTVIDIEFLQLLNITNVQYGIESHITPKSFVYSPFVDWYILLPTFLKGKDPALYVGNEILDGYGAYAQSGEKREKLEECNELGKAFLEGRESVKMMEFEEHAHALNGMRMYWKTTATDPQPADKNHLS
jgi:hypothetical protein